MLLGEQTTRKQARQGAAGRETIRKQRPKTFVVVIISVVITVGISVVRPIITVGISYGYVLGYS